METDVLIVGGGIAGGSLACALIESPYFENRDGTTKRIMLLDNSKIPSITDYTESDVRAPEPRVITLSPNSLRFLKSVGVLQLCDHRSITPFYEMLIYE